SAWCNCSNPRSSSGEWATMGSAGRPQASDGGVPRPLVDGAGRALDEPELPLVVDALVEVRRARDVTAGGAAIRELLLEIDLLGRGFASREQENGADQQGELSHSRSPRSE